MLVQPLPVRFRNPNFARAGLEWFVPAVLLLWVTIAINPAYRWAAASLFTVPALASGYYVLSWRNADLEVTRDGVVLGGVFRRHSLSWDQIDRFEILEPRRRTPFMLSFHWWADQARVVLTDGSRQRVRAVEPWHGPTVLTYLSVRRRTHADETVDWLNDLCRRANRARNQPE